MRTHSQFAAGNNWAFAFFMLSCYSLLFKVYDPYDVFPRTFLSDFGSLTSCSQITRLSVEHAEVDS